MLKGALLIVLLFIVYQDFKYRAVYWVCFPVMVTLLGTIKFVSESKANLLTDALSAGGFLLAQLLLLWVYFAVKHRKPVSLMEGYLGWGDVLFLLVLCFYFSPLNYIAFYMFSLVTAIVFALSTKLILSERDLTIPLAGIQSFLLIILLIVEWNAGLDFRHDGGISNLLLFFG